MYEKDPQTDQLLPGQRISTVARNIVKVTPIPAPAVSDPYFVFSNNLEPPELQGVFFSEPEAILRAHEVARRYPKAVVVQAVTLTDANLHYSETKGIAF